MPSAAIPAEPRALACGRPTLLIAILLAVETITLVWFVATRTSHVAIVIGTALVAVAVAAGLLVLARRRELALQRHIQSERRLRDELGTAHVMLTRAQTLSRLGSWESDQATRLVTLSPKALDLLGIPFGARVTADDILKLIAPEHHAIFQAARTAALERRQPWDVEVEVITHQGRRFWVESRGWPLVEQDRVVKLVGTIHDIDEQKRLTLALTESNRQLSASAARAEQLATEAQAAAQAKSLFLASMSHEIRTPMNGVIGFANLLQHTELSSEQRDYVRQIHACSEALLDSLNDVLDFTMLEHGRLELEVTRFSLREVLQSTIDFFAPHAAEKNLDLIADIAPEVPAAVLGDSGRVRQVVLNLVNNAIKFTARGEVFIGVEARAVAASDRVALRIVVRDTGIGVAPAAMEKLFQPFMQGDMSITRRFGGSGLGLALCKRLVDLMGGKIGVRSVAGHGSEFWFELALPVAPSAEAPDHAVNPPVESAQLAALDGASVLIVDDNATSRRVLAAQLARWGLRCTGAASAAEAGAILSRGTQFTFSLIDQMMPHTDGVALARSLRARHDIGAGKLVLLSALGARVGDDAAKLFAATLAKPVKPEELQRILLRLAGVPEASAMHAAPESDQFAGLRVLVVEDNPVNQRVVRLILRKLGIAADVAHHGRAAVASAHEREYDLIFMDLQMPEMDGIEATRTIRREIRERRQPMIVALTANAMRDDHEACLAAGMDGYLSKPARTEQLTEMLRRAQRRSVSV